MLRAVRLSVLAGASLAFNEDSEQGGLLQMKLGVDEDCSKGGCKPGHLSCELYGDPHILTFDGRKQHVYGPLGDYQIVHSDMLNIQSRYCLNGRGGDGAIKGSVGSKAGVAALAITGPAIGSQKDDGTYPILAIPSWSQIDHLNDTVADGNVDVSGVWMDNEQVIACKHSNSCDKSEFQKGNLRITYGDGNFVHYGKNQIKLGLGSGMRKNTFVIRAPGLHITVNQGHLQNVRLSIDPALLKGTTGHCGNADGVRWNDNLGNSDDRFETVSGRVAEKDRLFPHESPCEHQVAAEKTCDPVAEQGYEQKCKTQFPAQDDLEECVTDCCDADGVFPECPVGEELPEDA